MMQVKKYAIVNSGIVVNIVESSAEFAAAQGWIDAAGLAIGDVQNAAGFAPPVPDIEALKLAKNDELNAAWQAANTSTFPHAGKVFGCDVLSRGNIEGANGIISLLNALPPGWPGVWKAEDNTYLSITTVGEWSAFYGAMFAAGGSNFAHAQQLKQQLDTATTATEIEAVKW